MNKLVNLSLHLHVDNAIKYKESILWFKKKSKFYITLWFITWQTLEPTFAMRVLFCLVKRKFWKKKERKKKKIEQFAITFALSRRKSRDGIQDTTRIFHVCLDWRASETRRDTTTRRECGERRDSHQAARARARAFVRDDSQMLDRSSRYNPTSGQTGWF